MIEVFGYFKFSQYVPHHSLAVEATIDYQLQCMSTTAEVRYLCNLHSFDHVCATVPQHQIDAPCVNVPFFKLGQESLTDVLSGVGPKHGLYI